MSATTLPAVGLRGATVLAVQDLLAHPVPLVAANIVWGLVAFVAWMAALVSPLLGIVLACLLVWPTVAVAQVAAQVVRYDEVRLRDVARWPVARPAVAVLGLGMVLAATVAVVDIQAALGRGDLLGVAFATVAAWGLVALAVIACVAWPLLGDPRRAGRGVTETLRLAVSVTFVRTPRVIGACVLVWCFLIVSAVLAVALLTVSLGIAALVLAHVLLPIADGLDTGVYDSRSRA